MKSKYTEETLKPLVESSRSMRELLLKMGLYYSGGNYSYIKSRILACGLDMSHFKGQGWAKGLTSRPRVTADEYLVINSKSTPSTHTIRERILRDGIKVHQCEECKLLVWNNRPIPLEIHHIDGNKKNNLLTNLKLLCPNCHAQTNNHAGKANKKKSEF